MEAGSILVKRGLLSPQQLDSAAARPAGRHAARRGRRRLGLVSEEAALRALGDEVGIPFVDLEQQKIDLSLLRRLPAEADPPPVAVSDRSGTTARSIVATSDPFDLYPLDELSAATGLHDRAGAGQRERDRPADQDPPRRRQRDGRRPDGRSRTRRTSSCSTRSRPTTASSPKRPRRRRSSGW